MNNDTIKAVAESVGIIIDSCVQKHQTVRCCYYPSDGDIAKAAIEAMQIREMTENQLANMMADEIYENEDREIAFSTIALCQRIAWKLAKLGTIRIVGEV